MNHSYLYQEKPYAFADRQTIYTVDMVRLRGQPGLDGPVLRYVRPSTTCVVTGSVPVWDGLLTWWPVVVGDSRGYIAEAAPNGAPILAAASVDQQRQIINQEAERLDLPPAVAMAVFGVESAPYDLPSPHLVLNFEPHILSDYLFERAVGNQGIFYRHFAYGSPPWTNQRWRSAPSSPWISLGGNQENERQAIDLACRLFGREAALRATSMGPGQVMGFCHEMMGYPDARAMFDAWRSEPLAAVRGFFRYIEATELVRSIQQRDWLAFAAGYNGIGAHEEYARKLVDAIAYMEHRQSTVRGSAARQIAG